MAITIGARTTDNDTPSVESIVQQPPEAAPPNDALNRIEQLLVNMAGRLGRLETRVAQQGQAIPKFQPMQPAEGVNPHPKPNLQELTKANQATSGEQQLPTRTNVAGVLFGYPQRFQKDDLVRLNPEVGTGEILTRRGKADVTALVGTVIGLHFIDKMGEVKYRVNFPGLTNRRGDGFRESELITA